MKNKQKQLKIKEKNKQKHLKNKKRNKSNQLNLIKVLTMSHNIFDELSYERMSEIKDLSKQTDCNNLT